MRNDPAQDATRALVLPGGEADRRKALLTQLQHELTAQGAASVLAGRHVLRLSSAGPWAPSGPGNPELHILGPGHPCRATTDSQRYIFPGGTAHPVDDPAGAARHLLTHATCNGGAAEPTQPADHTVRAIGSGERALRQLIADGLI